MKNLLTLIILSFLFISISVNGAEIQAELNLTSAPEILQEGDLVEAILKVWPVENGELSEFRDLDNKMLGNALLVSDVESVGVSANNADVIEVKLLLIVKRSGENTSQTLIYKGQPVLIQIPPLKIEASDKDPEDYFVMDQGILRTHLNKIILGSVLLLLILIVIWKKNSLKNFFKKFKADPVAAEKKNFHELFQRASTRNEYERIYATKSGWMKLIVVQSESYKEFFATMEQHQYKKSWGSVELQEVKSAFDVIRGSFK